MSDAITCRLLTADDAPAFLALRLRGCREEPSAFLEDYEEIKDKTVEDAKRHFQNGWIAGAFLENALVGVAGLFGFKGIKTRHKGKVWGVYTAPEARGLGIARRLITMVVEEARKTGIEVVHLSTNVENPVSIGLYKSLGFEPWGVEKHIMKLPEGYVDDVMMVKFL